MKFLIVGSGGTGGVLGGYLARQGEDVTFLARGEHLEAMRQRGLRIKSSKYGEFSINPCKAYTIEEYRDTPDVILVCVKYYSLQSAIDLVRRVAQKDTLIIPVLNVFGTGQVMQEALGEAFTVLDGCIYVFAMKEEPGVILQPQDILRVFFGFRQGQSQTLREKALKVEELLKKANIGGGFSEDIAAAHLQKFSFVSPMGATGLYYAAKSEDFQREGEIREFFKGMILEVEALGRAMGITFKEDLVQIGLKLIDSFAPGGTTSMQRDVAMGNSSEFAGLVEHMVTLGRKYNVSMPLYERVAKWGQEKGIK